MTKFLSSLSNFFVYLLFASWFWWCLAVAVGILILVLGYRALKLWALGKLQYDRSFSADGIFVGETIDLTENVKNSVWFPLLSVQVEFFVPSGVTIDGLKCTEYTKVTSIFSIPPFSSVSKKHTVIADRRDHYRLNTASILYRKNEFLFSDALDFYAYPDVYHTKLLLPSELYESGNALAEKKQIEDLFFFSGIRPYQKGDPMRAINFKASVRSFGGGLRQLLCNQYDSSRNCDSMVFLNLSSSSESALKEEETMEIGLRYACFLFREALKHAGRYGFAANCSRGSFQYISIPCGSGELHTKQVLEAFSEITWYARRDYSMNAIFQKILPTLSPSTDIFLITLDVDDELAKSIHYAETMGYSVGIIPLEGRRIR